MSVLAIAKGLATFAPTLARFLGGDKAGDVADQAVAVAKRITGSDNENAALTALQNNPELQVKFQEAIAPVLVAQNEAEAKQIAEINATMRAELSSNSKYKSGWRPTFGWAVVITWSIQMLAISIVIIINPVEAVKLINAMAALGFMWSMALAVLGININKRSQDKQVAVGQSPLGVVGAIVKRIAGK